MSTKNIIANGKTLNDILSDWEYGKDVCSLYFNILLEVLSSEIKLGKGIKRIKIEKKEVRLLLFTKDMIEKIESIKNK